MTDERVLVVDHIDDRREDLVELIESQGITVLQASNCEEALKLLAHEHVGIVLSETDLPRKSGLFLLKEAKIDYPDVEVILLTHNASSFTLLQALRLGAYDFIVRPIDTGEILFNTLGRAFTHRQYQQQREDLLQELETKNRKLNQTLHRMQSLTNAIAKIAAQDDIQKSFTTLLEVAIKDLAANSGFVALFDKGGESLGIKVSRGIGNVTSQQFARQLPAGLTTAIAHQAKTVLVVSELPDALGVMLNEHEDQLYSFPGLIAVPLRIKDRVAGILIVSGHQNNVHFADHDLLYLTQLVQHTEMQLEKVGMIHQLTKTKKKNVAQLRAIVS
ncbi:MAG TPA: response regulator [Geopsychrobacteraceae bacterium]|nr:response regulator [Geopsychrobacteraceae bacterium]